MRISDWSSDVCSSDLLSLNVLDDRQLERLGVAEVADDDRHLMQLGALGRPPEPLTGDNLELVRPVRVAADQDRMQEPLRLDRFRERIARSPVARVTRMD